MDGWMDGWIDRVWCR